MIARRYRKPLPAQEVLRSILHYDPDTGVLTWLERPLSFFLDGEQSAAQSRAAWNAKHAGMPAFKQKRQGYMGGTLFGEKVQAHRVIWKWMTGDEPDHIDHQNGVGTDNRWGNLRNVCAVGNAQNQAIRADNTSGVTGVTWTSRFGGKWVAQICADGKALFLGQFDNFSDAVTARKAAEKRYGFHENHGRRK